MSAEGGDARARETHDPVAPEVLRADVARVLDTLEQGGVAIVPLDVAYGVIGQTEQGIRRIFAAKNRSYEKPSGLFGSAELSRELHILPDETRVMIDTIVREEGLPFSVVAPYDPGHALLRATDPFVLQSSTKDGTLDMLLNAGQVHDEIARQSAARGRPVFGSSANTSLQGSKYRLEDIEAPVRDAAAIALDYGRSRYANDLGRSSTIIDFRDFSVIRVGVCFDRLETAFARRFDVTLRLPEGMSR